ncbi:hypothetical protein HK099_001494 [Clydaea vesicula]|uniref:Uncharacterized protein n=1 Tax=Clydaea vesicula TaxID=447962 RepID=A0AAD5Y1U1_9FUNG|nr:hypothetical protein HK099_001494 [Clydaea vesicula]
MDFLDSIISNSFVPSAKRQKFSKDEESKDTITKEDLHEISNKKKICENNSVNEKLTLTTKELTSTSNFISNSSQISKSSHYDTISNEVFIDSPVTSMKKKKMEESDNDEIFANQINATVSMENAEVSENEILPHSEFKLEEMDDDVDTQIDEEEKLSDLLDEVEDDNLDAGSSKNDSSVLSSENLKNLLEIPTPVQLKVGLLQHQKIGVEWMLDQERNEKFRGGILADDMGLGKTLQTIATMVEDKVKYHPTNPTLILCPKSLCNQWKVEFFDKVQTGIFDKVYIYSGSKRIKDPKILSKFDVLISPISTLAAEFEVEESEEKKFALGQSSKEQAENEEEDCVDTRKAKKSAKAVIWEEDELGGTTKFKVPPKRGPLFHIHWHRIVIDEAHGIKNRDTVKFKAVFNLNAQYRWLLTGTPIQNSLVEMHSYFKFLRVSPLNEYAIFRIKVLHPFNSGRESEALNYLHALMDRTLLRRCKTDTIDGHPIISLPPITKFIVKVCFQSTLESDLYRALYTKAREEIRRLLKAGTLMKNYTNVLAWLLRLRQACSHHSLITTFNEKLAAEVEEVEKKKELEKTSIELSLISKMDNFLNGPKECSICFEEPVYPSGGINSICGHFFCKICTDKLIEAENECAVCRGHLERSVLISIKNFVSQFDIEAKLRMDLMEKEKRMCELKELEKIQQLKADNFGVTPGTIKVDKNWSSSTKIERCLSVIKKIELKNEGKTTEKIVIFSQWVKLLDLLEVPLFSQKIKYERYTGSMSMEQRLVAIQNFKNDPECNIILVSLQCGSLGLNLVMANHVILLDLWWNPAVESQAFDRVHRIGQKKPVEVHKILISNTVEQRIEKIQEEKQRIADMVLKSEGKGMGNTNKLSEKDFKDLFEIE